MCVYLCLSVGPSGGRKRRQRRSSGHRRMLTWTRPSVISWTMAPFSTRLSRRTGQSSILVGGVDYSLIKTVHISQVSMYITTLGNSKYVQNCSKNNEKGKRSPFVAIGPSIAQPGDTVLLLKASCHFSPPYHGTGISTILLRFPIIVPVFY